MSAFSVFGGCVEKKLFVQPDRRLSAFRSFKGTSEGKVLQRLTQVTDVAQHSGKQLQLMTKLPAFPKLSDNAIVPNELLPDTSWRGY